MEPEYPEEDEQVFSSVERPVGAAFFFPGALDGPAPAWLADKIDRAGLAPVDSGEDGLVAVGWAGLRCEAHVLALDEFTVLVLVFGWLDLLGARVESATPDTDGVPPPPADATPLARAFLDTCTRLDLGADLAVAVVQGEPVPNLFGQCSPAPAGGAGTADPAAGRSRGQGPRCDAGSALPVPCGRMTRL